MKRVDILSLTMALTRMVKRREGHRAQCLSLCKIIKDEVESESVDVDKLKKARDELNRQTNTVLELNEEVLDKIDQEQMIEEIRQASEINMENKHVLQLADKFIDDKSCDIDKPKTLTTKSVKLPTIVLPKFSGNIMEWQQFWDLYSASIHDRKDIPDATKFNYLSSQLVGEAANLLMGFNHTKAEYNEAIKLLQSTYGKPEKLVEAHLHAIIDLSAPEASANSLSNFRSKYEGHLRGLKTLGKNVTDSGFVFAVIILRKLPRTVHDRINRESHSDSWTLENLRKAIDTEIGHLQSTESPNTTPASSSSASSGTMSLVVPSQRNITYSCQLCDGEHSPVHCTKYKSAEARREQVMKKRLCFNCLRENHPVIKCRSEFVCRGCGKKHHSALCYGSGEEKYSYKNQQLGGQRPVLTGANIVTQDTVPDAPAEPPASATTVPLFEQNSSQATSVLPTAILNIKQGDTLYKVHALFDLGSQRTFILKSVVDRLDLSVVSSVNLSISGFNKKVDARNYEVVKFSVTSDDDIINSEAVVIESLPDNISMKGRSNLVGKLRHRGIRLADDTDNCDNFTDIGVLIGADQYYDYVYADMEEDVALIPSKIGYLTSGRIINSTVNSTVGSSGGSGEQDISSAEVVTVLRVGVTNDDLDSTLKRQWEMDSVGIKPTYETDQLATDEFNDCVRFEDGHFVARLPWKTKHPFLPTNYSLALSRLKSNIHSLAKTPNLLNTYDSIIKGQLDNNFIEKVENTRVYSNNLHYIPHHAVAKESRTTPLRIVFDCAARSSPRNPSLNDCLFSGPSLINEMLGVFMRFRAHRLACVSDIAKAYLMVHLDQCDRDATRFLWVENINDQSYNFVTYRFKVVFFGATCSQFLLNLSLKIHLQGVDNFVARELERSLYVDNVVYSCSEQSKLLEFYRKSCSIMSDAGFNLREWATNCKTLNEVISSDVSTIDEYKQSDEMVNVLGMKWSVSNDKMSFKIRKMSLSNKFTKRIILSQTSKIYDPLGILLPVTVRAKLLIRDLWDANVGWDEELSEEFVARWKSLSVELNTCQTISFDRSLSFSGDVEVHAFGDSSTIAYGAIVFMRQGKSMKFVIAKCRVVPVKAPTLPQLELTATNLAARLASYTIKHYSSSFVISSVHIWSDSTIVLSWLNGSKVMKQYVQQRIDNITALVPNAEFHFINSSDNAADLLTRGIKAESFLDSSLWMNGPKFLQDEQWRKHVPQIPCSVGVYDLECDPVLSTNLSVQQLCNFVPDISFIDRFSSFPKLIRVTAYVSRFVNRARNPSSLCLNRELSVSEYIRAETTLVSLVQQRYFPLVFDFLKNNSKHCPSIVKQLNLVLCDTVVVCRGRLQNSSLNDHAKYPILLPSVSKFTNLLIEYYHLITMHSGINYVMGSIREKYWIPRARQRIKAMLRLCMVCKRHHSRLISMPSTAPYPGYRVVQSRPFCATGLDYTGALNVKGSAGIFKVYVCLFTCLSTRAVHLELAEDGTTEAFMKAFRRFAARRSCPEFLMSDNASIFSAASINIATLTKNLSYMKVQWKFIPARAPHFGGVWERMIGITKMALKKILGTTMISFTDLNTILCEIESTINDRPLMYCSDDISDEPLTPSKLLCGHNVKCFGNAGVDFEQFLDPSFQEKCVFSKREQFLRILLDNYWTRWKREYLHALRERDRDILKPDGCSVSVGDIVFIHDDKPRAWWYLGKVVSVHESSDGVVRSVSLQTKNGLTTRPIVKLIHTEIRAGSDSVPNGVITETVRTDRPQRQAAVVARDKIASIFN